MKLVSRTYRNSYAFVLLAILALQTSAFVRGTHDSIEPGAQAPGSKPHIN